MAKRKKPLTDYGIKRKFGLVDGKDIPAVAIAVANEGFYFEQETEQDLSQGVHNISFVFPDGPVCKVALNGPDPAFAMARQLIDEEILPGKVQANPVPETVDDLFPFLDDEE